MEEIRNNLSLGTYIIQAIKAQLLWHVWVQWGCCVKLFKVYSLWGVWSCAGCVSGHLPVNMCSIFEVKLYINLESIIVYQRGLDHRSANTHNIPPLIAINFGNAHWYTHSSDGPCVTWQSWWIHSVNFPYLKSQGLVRLHNFTGADWEGEFCGISKKMWISSKLALHENDPIINAFKTFGNGEISSSTLIDGNLPEEVRANETFVCSTYCPQGLKNPPPLRWNLFWTVNIEGEMLPPTRATLLSQTIKLPWGINHTLLHTQSYNREVWMSHHIHKNTCSCKNNLPCMPLCRCSFCSNLNKDDEVPHTDDHNN